MARRKAAPSGAAVEQPLAIDGSAAAEPSADAADEPVAVYGHSADIHELKAAHDARESDPAWQESVAVYRPMTAEVPGFEVAVRGSDVPDAEPEPESEPAHAVVHHADLGPDFLHIDSPECLCLKPASDDE